MKDEYFVPQEKSPRNQLIRICTSETTDYDLIGDIFLSVMNNEFAHTTSSSHIKNKRRRIQSQFKPRLTITHILKYYPRQEKIFMSYNLRMSFLKIPCMKVLKKNNLYTETYIAEKTTIASSCLL